MERQYIIKTASGGFVGLFNYGRTYQVAKCRTTITATPAAARLIAKAFNGTITEV